MEWLSLFAAILLALTHLFAEKLNFSFIPRSKWLSFAGGVSVSYIFLHLLPELAEGQETIKRINLYFLKNHTYLIALFGLIFFYGLEKAAKQSYQSAREATAKEMNKNLKVFWLHITSFGVYNAMVGYLMIHREENTWLSLLWFTLAMGFHFVVNDYSLKDHYQNAYRKKGRWVITFAIIGGALAGLLGKIPHVWITVLFAFIAGGTIMNVLKEEIPTERKSNFWAFAFGILLYSAMLLLV